mmetsp:Transcript_176665/g.566497  ORF Transcript_176665/g.566497 Transcript_176665/m.566497 type:complete len:528 (+) Transcript_176665:122-1705(+)
MEHVHGATAQAAHSGFVPQPPAQIKQATLMHDNFPDYMHWDMHWATAAHNDLLGEQHDQITQAILMHDDFPEQHAQIKQAAHSDALDHQARIEQATLMHDDFSELQPRSPGNMGDPMRALSVHYLCTEFVELVWEADLAGSGSCSSSMQEIEEHVVQLYGSSHVCPRDGRLGCAFVDLVESENCAGAATHMLSYTWGYSLQSITDALSTYCARSGLDPQRTYVWMCVFCINQFRVRESKAAGHDVSFEDFSSEFSNRVQNIGHVLSLMEPWQAPKNLSRAWCVYELFMAMDEPGCKLDLLMLSSCESSFATAFNDRAEDSGMWESISKVCLEKADASVDSDKEHIVRLVQQGVGIEALNFRVRSKLRSWFVDIAHNHALSRLRSGTLDEAAQTCTDVARLFIMLDRYDMAIDICQKNIDRLASASALGTHAAAKVLAAMGRATCLIGRYHDGGHWFNEATRIHLALGTIGTSATTDLVEWRGLMHASMGQIGEASTCLSQSILLRESACSLATRPGMRLLLGLAVVR